jgi:TrmH family RNA methyltransferase
MHGRVGYQLVSIPIRIVLVETSHPGNIGAVARALKNMALEQLVLVNPKQFPHAEASARASGAEDLLNAARVTHDLKSALEGCGLVLATTSRERDQNFRVLDPRAAALTAVEHAERAPVAIMFGAERTGLTNQELRYAHALLAIPANPAYPSLNVAMAVQIVAYEIMCAWLVRAGEIPRAIASPAVALASPEELDRLYEHLGQVLEEIDFRDRTQSGTHLMNRIRRMLQRAEPDLNEVHILRGILTAIQQRRRRAVPHG